MAHMKIIHTTELFDDWFAGLRDKLAEKRIQARIRRAELGNFGDCAPVAKAYRKCAFIMAQVIAFILRSGEWKS